MDETNMNKVTPETPYEEAPMKAPEPYYPNFRLKLKDIPESRDWRVGDTYMMVVGVKMTSIAENEEGGSVCFDVLKVKPANKKKNKKK